MLGKAALPSIAGFGLEAVDEVDHVVEAATRTGSDAASGDGDRQMSFTGTCSANQHDVALLGDESAAGEIVDERLVDRRAVELEVGDVLGKWQLGDSELVVDRSRLLLVDRSGPRTKRCGASGAARRLRMPHRRRDRRCRMSTASD